MNERLPLPNKRRSKTLEWSWRGAPYTITYSCFEDGGLAEVFIHHRHSSKMSHGLEPLNDDAKDAAVALSIALQYGAPAEVIRRAMTRLSDGKAIGLMGAVLDLLRDESEEWEG